MRAQILWMAILVVLFGSASGQARADVAPPPTTDYEVQVDGINVKIYLLAGGAHGFPCNRAQPDSYSLVRENVTTREVHLLPLVCQKDGKNNEYVADYCVPEGEYRYGLLTPINCGQYHGTAKVGPLKPCTDPRKLAPKKHTGATPWAGKATNATPCDFNDGDETGCAVSGVSVAGAAQVGAGALLVLLLVGLRRRESAGRR